MSMWCRFAGSVVMTTGLSLHSPHGGRARRRRCRSTRVPGTRTKVHRRRGSNGEQDWMNGGGPGLPGGGGRRWELTLIWSPTDETQRRARAGPPAADVESRSPPTGQTPEGVSRWSAGDSGGYQVAVGRGASMAPADLPAGAQEADAHQHRPRCGAASGAHHQCSLHTGQTGMARPGVRRSVMDLR